MNEWMNDEFKRSEEENLRQDIAKLNRSYKLEEIKIIDQHFKLEGI